MVQAGAVDEDRLSVEAETLLGIIFYSAYAEGHVGLIQDGAILLCQRQVRRVHLWLLRCPQTWLGNFQEYHCRHS